MRVGGLVLDRAVRLRLASNRAISDDPQILQATRPVDLARVMNVRPRVVNQLATLWHPTRIDKITQAFKAPGKRLELPVR